MFCPNCGKEVPDGSSFCNHCGGKLAVWENRALINRKLGAGTDGNRITRTATPGEQMPEAVSGNNPIRPGSDIELGEDGVYRWIYEFHMLKNPVILFTILKIFGIIFGILFGFIAIDSLLNHGIDTLKDNMVPLLIFLAVFAVIILLSYGILASMYGWKYIVLFEMDEKGIRHIQQPKQFTKAEGLAWLAAFAGVAAGNPARGIGQRLLIASNNMTSSNYDTVRKVKVMRFFHTIKISELFSHNQIYAKPEDFDFVLNYILARGPEKAKKR